MKYYVVQHCYIKYKTSLEVKIDSHTAKHVPNLWCLANFKTVKYNIIIEFSILKCTPNTLARSMICLDSPFTCFKNSNKDGDITTIYYSHKSKPLYTTFDFRVAH